MKVSFACFDGWRAVTLQWGERVTRSTAIIATRKVFLRACSALVPENWDKQATQLRAVDVEGWDFIRDLAVRHGLLGLVARNLEWAHRRTGVPIPVLDQVRTLRQGQLVQMLVRRNAARRIAESLAARGIRFVIFRGLAFIEQVYGELSLRAFRDCDILVERDRLEAAYAVLRGLGYSLTEEGGLQQYLVRDKSGANMAHSDGSSVDLHWAIQGYEMPASNPEVIWRHCRPPDPWQHLPGWRMSSELTVIIAASHFQVHEYEELKPLVDFYLTAVRLGASIKADRLLGLAETLGMTHSVDLAARLCEKMFIHNPLVARLALSPPSMHTRLALGLLKQESLLRLERMLPTARRIRGLLCHASSSSSARAVRKMLIPRSRELELRFRRPFNLAMYPKYYLAQAQRVLTRSRMSLSDIMPTASPDGDYRAPTVICSTSSAVASGRAGSRK